MSYKVKFIKKEEIARDTITFYFEKPLNFKFEPGQYINIDLIDPKDNDEKGSRRAMSIASAPSEDFLSVSMRMSDSSFKKNLVKMLPGDEIEIHGPLGHIILPKETDRPIVFLAGGIGVVPFRSMIVEDALKGGKYDITLLYSNREIEDISFYEELKNIDHPQYRSVFTITSSNGSDWSEEFGRIDEKMLRKYINDIKEPIYYIVGLLGMVKGLRRTLVEMGVRGDRIKFESYGLYK